MRIKLSSFLGCVHLWHLLSLALAKCYMPLSCLLIECSSTNWALDWSICMLCCCFLLSSQSYPFPLFETCSKGSTLLLPLRYFTFLLLCWLFLFFFYTSHRRRSLEFSLLSLSMGCWVESLSLRLEDFLTYFLVFFNSLSTKLSSTASWTLNHLNLFTVLIVRYRLLILFLGWLRRRSFGLLLCHLSLEYCHKILIWIQRNLFVWVNIVLINWHWSLFSHGFLVIDCFWLSFLWHFWLFLRHLRGRFFDLLLVSVVLFMLGRTSWLIPRLFDSFLGGRTPLAFLSTHTIPHHSLLKQLKPMFSFLNFTRGHILIDLVIYFLRRSRPRRQHFFSRWFFVHSWLFLCIIGIIKVVRFWWWGLLCFIESILRPRRWLLV